MFSQKAVHVLKCLGSESSKNLVRSLPHHERRCAYHSINLHFNSNSIPLNHESKRVDCNKYKYNVRHFRTNVITDENIVISPYDDFEMTNSLVHEVVWENLERWPDRIAIECSLTKRKYTFAQLRKYSKQFAASLLKSGIKPGQVVSLVMPNIPEYPIVLLGASEVGIVVSPVNPAYTADEICHQLSNSESVAIVTYADKLDVVKEAASKSQQKTQLPVPLRIISMQNYDGVSRESPSGTWSLQDMFLNDSDTSIVDTVCSQHVTKPDDLVFLPYSSGTTGLPKGVCLTHRNITSNIIGIAAKGSGMNLEPQGEFQDVLVAVLPFFHIYGLVIILFESLKHGGKLVTLPKFDPNNYVNTLQEYKSTVLYTVPPVVLFLSSHKGINRDMFHQTRHIMCAAAPIGQFDIEKCLERFPTETVFKQGYGLTETSPITMICPNDNKALSSVGPPSSMTKVKIVDPNSGKNLGANENGEVCIFGPQVMKGYHKRPEATLEMIDKDNWLHTGDIGYYDENGYFYIVDRIKELIKVKGFQVAPAELEELLRSHPKVADVAVIGVPDERSGETPVAFIVPRPGQESVAPQELVDYVSSKVTKYKHVSKVIITDSIPKNPSGKILRRKLRDSHIKASL